MNAGTAAGHWLLDPVVAAERLAAAGLPVSAATPTYLRDKPGETMIVGLRLIASDGTTALAYARWCADADRAATIHAKALTLGPRPSLPGAGAGAGVGVGAGVMLVGSDTVVYGFPNDARLRRLHRYGTAHRLRRTFEPLDLGARLARDGHQLQVLRYKPERRLIAVAHLAFRQGSGAGGGSGAVGGEASRSVLVRYTTRTRAPFLARMARLLAAHGVDTPAPLGVLEGGRVGVDAFVPGRDLAEAVRAGESNAEALAERLVSLHGVPVPDIPSDHHQPAPTLARVGRGLDQLVHRHGPLAPVAEALTGQLARHLPDPAVPALIHGDLDGGNVLVDGDRHWFIDLERIGPGPAAADLGRLVAHALTLDLIRPGWSTNAVEHAHAVVDAYRRRQPIPDRPLAWYTAIGLADQALLASRQLQAGWAQQATRLLDEARNLITAPHRQPLGARP